MFNIFIFKDFKLCNTACFLFTCLSIRACQFGFIFIKIFKQNNLKGDSGGPLMCQREDACSWYIYGIVSYGDDCAHPDFFGVYTNVTAFEGWIEEKIKNGK